MNSQDKHNKGKENESHGLYISPLLLVRESRFFLIFVLTPFFLPLFLLWGEVTGRASSQDKCITARRFILLVKLFSFFLHGGLNSFHKGLGVLDNVLVQIKILLELFQLLHVLFVVCYVLSDKLLQLLLLFLQLANLVSGNLLTVFKLLIE